MASAPDPRKLASQQRAEVARWSRWVITIDDGAPMTFRLGEVTALDTLELRRQASMNVAQILVQAEMIAGTVWDIDATAALIWMARRQAGDTDLTFVDVAGSLRLDQVIEIRHEDAPEPAEVFPDPLAEAAAPARPARARRRVRNEAVGAAAADQS